MIILFSAFIYFSLRPISCSFFGILAKNILMKYQRINSDLYIKNRKNFTSSMESNTLAVFNSNDIFPISADSTMPFEQHRDILHLTGVDQEESILVLFPDSSNPKHKEVLFLKETSELIAIWEGEKLDKMLLKFRE